MVLLSLLDHPRLLSGVFIVLFGCALFLLEKARLEKVFKQLMVANYQLRWNYG